MLEAKKFLVKQEIYYSSADQMRRLYRGEANERRASPA